MIIGQSILEVSSAYHWNPGKLCMSADVIIGRASVHCGHDAIYFAGYDSGTHAGVLQRYDLVTQQLEQLAAATRGFKGMAHLKDGILAWGEGQVLNEVEPTQATFPIIFSQWDVGNFLIKF